jgi:hypothetical protein
MDSIATYDRIDVGVCGEVAMLLATAYGMTKQNGSAVGNDDSELTLADKVAVWAIVGMLSSILVAVVVRR